MGCISTKDLNPNLNSTDENAFRVRVIRVCDSQRDPTRTLIRGVLEINPRSLVFETRDAEPIVWELKRLRRYGLTDNVFTFESGRRCPTGEGIHVFHCSNAEEFYEMFRHYLTTVFDIRDTFPCDDRAAGEHPSHSFPPPAAESNNYLEPEPVDMCAGLVSMVDDEGKVISVSAGTCGAEGACGGAGVCGATNRFQESLSTSPLSLDTPSSSCTPTDVLCHSLQQPTTPCGAGGGAVYVNTVPSNGNLYLDHPLHSTAQLQSNNNNNNGGCSGNFFGNKTRKTIIRGTSLDVPPVECAPLCAPILTPTSDAPHMYANIEGLGGSCSSACSTRERDREKWLDLSTERCYENFNRADLPLLLQSPTTLPSPQGTVAVRKPELKSHHSYPDSPITPVAWMAPEAPEVNYIVLDLDTPRSPTNPPSQNEQSGLVSSNSLAANANRTNAAPMRSAISGAATTATTAGVPSPTSSMAMSMTTLSLTGTKNAADSMPRTATTTSLSSTKTNATTNTTKTNEANSVASTTAVQNCSRLITEIKKEEPLGYSTIDFIKTCALFSSSKQTTELDSSIEHDDGSTRKTRHSAATARLLKRKACSISE